MKKILNYLILFSLVATFNIYYVGASFPDKLTNITQFGYKEVDSYGFSAYLKKSKNGYSVFCADYYKTTPATASSTEKNPYPGSVTCNLSDSWTLAVRAGVATIISNSKISNSLEDANANYLKAELTLSWFLYNYDKRIGERKVYDGAIRSSWYEEAIKAYKKVKDIRENISISINDGTITEDAKNYYIKTSVKTEKSDGWEVLSVTKGTGSKNGNNITITIPKTDLEEGKNTITLKVKAYNKEYVARNYNCGTNYQTITPAHTENATIATKEATKKFTITKSSKGSLTIIKKDSVTNEVIEGAGFQLFSGSGCNKDKQYAKLKETSSDGKITYKDLKAGEYSVYEYTIPDGYIEPTNRCTNITVSAGKTTKKTITNTPQGNLTIIKKDSVTNEVIEGAGFQLFSGSGCNKDKQYAKLKETSSDGKITYKDLKAGEYSVYEYTIPNGYIEPTNRCTNITVSAGGTTSKTITNTPKGGLKIKKTTSNIQPIFPIGTTGSKKAKFNLYSNKNCSASSLVRENFESGTKISNLNPGTYYLKEIEAPTGYHTPKPGEKWSCEEIEIKSGETNEITVDNKTNCEIRFENDPDLKTNKAKRIALYNELKTNSYEDFRNLLDFTKQTAREACSTYEPDYKPTESCMASKQVDTSITNNFTANNISAYNDTITYNGKTHYCLTEFDLENVSWENGKRVTSGQFVVQNDVLAKLTLKKTCYIHGTSMMIPLSKIVNSTTDRASDYYGNIILDGRQLESTSCTTTDGGVLEFKSLGYEGEFYKYVSTTNLTYSPWNVFSTVGDGINQYNDCSYCRYLGRGVISAFSSSEKTVNLSFKIEDGTNDVFDFSEGTYCSYTSVPEITDNNKLQVEFRTVTTNSDVDFLNKEGENRVAGANWSDESIQEEVLDGRNNSYNKTNEGYKYKIKLTPSLVDEIRDYNKEKGAYDDYQNLVDVDGDKKYESTFLKDLNERGILEISGQEDSETTTTTPIISDSTSETYSLSGSVCQIFGQLEEPEEDEIIETKPCTLNDIRNNGIDASDEVTCGTEKFYVMETLDNDRISMLAKYNLDLNTKLQSSNPTKEYIAFSKNNKIADITFGNKYVYNSKSNLYTYVEAYEAYLKNIGVSSASATLISSEDYDFLWLYKARPQWLKSESYWTGSTSNLATLRTIICINSEGKKSIAYDNSKSCGVRPKIIISTSEIN